MKTASLLSIGSDAKTVKGESLGWRTAILYLAPAREAGRGNVCSHASAGCLASCLYKAGRGAFSNVQRSRINKTLRFFDQPKEFKAQLVDEIKAFIASSQHTGLAACVRLNGTSDIPWELLGIPQLFPADVPFYDYTKNPRRAIAHAKRELPSNYHLTFSRSECNDADALQVLEAGGNVAVVFSGDLPSTWQGYPVIDGDLSDLRFLDPRGSVVGLRAKGPAKRDTSGFVVQS
jgi:hypothetical protein